MKGVFDLEHLECFDTILDDEETAPCEFNTFKKLLECKYSTLLESCSINQQLVPHPNPPANPPPPILTPPLQSCCRIREDMTR